MSKSLSIDFEAIKTAVTMEQVLQHYGLMKQFKRDKNSLIGPCPIHKGTDRIEFRVNTNKKVWNCFGECNHGGNVLDFIAILENISLHAAAVKAIEWFRLVPEPNARTIGSQIANHNSN